MKKESYSFFIVLAIVTLFSTACKKIDLDQIADSKWNPNLALPIGSAKFDFKSFSSLTDSTALYVSDPFTGQLSFSFKDRIFTMNGGDLVEVPHQTNSIVLNTSDIGGVAAPSFVGILSNDYYQMLNFAVNNGEELTQMEILNGNLILNVSNSFKHNVSFLIEFPDFKKNNQTVSTTFDLNYSGTTPITHSETIPLADVLADMTISGTTFNSFRIKISYHLTGTGEEITSNDEIIVNYTLADIKPKSVKGYLGQQNLNFNSDSLFVEALFVNTNGVLKLTNPSVKFHVENDFGIPAEMTINDVEKIDLKTLQVVNLTGFNNPYIIPTALNENTPSSSIIVLDKSTVSNIDELVSINEFVLLSNIDFALNNVTISHNNFVNHTHELTIDMETDVPIEGYGYGIQFEDTLDFNAEIDFVESAMFRLISTNGFPLGIAVQGYFLDENDQVLFNVFDNGSEMIIDPATVDANGFVLTSATKQTDIHLLGQKLDLLPKAKKIRLVGIAETTNGTSNQVVKFCDYNKMDIKVSAKIKANVAINVN